MVVHVVRGHDVLEALAHLAELTVDRFAFVGVHGLAVHFALLNVLGRHILTAVIGVGIRLDHALVEKLVERFERIHVPQVEQDLMPEP